MSEGEGSDRIGSVLGGRYELRDVIGSGAQGFLYRARDNRGGEDVAIKILRNAANDPDAVERLFREAQAMTQLLNTAAVRVLDQVTAAEGGIGIVMELLRGRDLDDELSELERAGERMPLYQVVDVFGPIVSTLEVARQAGIIHRDIKPPNIFLVHPAYGGGVRLLDFGFARFTGTRRITKAGMIAGSPRYLSPEAWLGVTDLDHRADAYGLAVVLYRVLAGKLPFEGSDYLALMKAVTAGPRPSLHALRPDLPDAIDGWVALALNPDRDRRFQTAKAMWSALRTCLVV